MSKLVKNSAIYIVSDFSVKAITFLLLPLFTRLISPDDYGNIQLLVSIGNFLTVIASLTLGSSISRFYFSNNSDFDLKLMFSEIVKFTVFFSTTIYLLIFIFGEYIFFFIKIEFHPYVTITLLSSYFSIYYIFIASLLRAKQDATKLSVITVISSLFSSLLTLILVIQLEDKVFAYLFSILITSIFNFIIFIIFSKNYFYFKKSHNRIKIYLKYSITRLPIDLSSWIVMLTDRVLLYELKGERDTGIYSVGAKIGQAFQIIFMAINKAFVPFAFEKISKKENNNYDELSNIVLKLFGFYCIIWSIGVIFSPEIVMLLDSSFYDNIYLLPIILLSFLFLSLKLLFQPPMDYYIEYVKIKALIWIIGSALNVILNIILIPKFSMNGAAFASFLTYFLMLFPIIYFSNKAIPIKYNYFKMIQVFIISVLFSLIFMIKVNLSISILKFIASGFYIYFIANILEFNGDDIKIFIKKWNKN